MARIRYLKPEFTQDIDTASLSIAARYLYQNLWCHMDKAGVCESDPRTIKKDVFPYDDEMTSKKVNLLVDELIGEGFLFRIAHKSKNYLYCPTLRKHQLFHRHEKERHSIPESVLKGCTVQAPVEPRASTGQDQVSTRIEVLNYPLPITHSPLPVTSSPCAEDFERLYREFYPRKEGKSEGIKRCLKQIKTWEDFGHLARAIQRYAVHCSEKDQFVKHFDSFMGSDKTGHPWRDWLDPDAGMGPPPREPPQPIKVDHDALWAKEEA